MKPMLACDWDEQKLRFPMMAQPKIDGVRGLNLEGKLTTRRLKPHANKFTTDFYSGDWTLGFDGEFCADSEVSPSLCRTTSSALRTITGTPFTLWWLFDYITEQTINLTYLQRYVRLIDRISRLKDDREKWDHLRIVPYFTVMNYVELADIEKEWVSAGYEGVILRDPNGKYKQGRCTSRENNLLRIKRFEDAEAVVIAVQQGERNENEAQVNELGKTFRTTHAENMVPNGLAGSFICRDLERTKEFIVSAGEIDHATRRAYWEDQSLIVGKTITYKHFPKGVKDKPRFPTFKCIRDDLG